MGGLTKRSAQVQIPGDMSSSRQGNIELLNYILGFGQQGQQKSLMGGARAQSPQGFAPLGDPTSRLQSVFGSLAPAGISQFLNQPTPEQRALDTSLPALQEILTPGTNNPLLDRDLALANQQGGRFGSANAILRSNALANLFGMRTQAANTLGVLGRGAGEGQARTAGLMDLETQRRLQLMMQLLGVSQGASFNLPFVTQPSWLDSASQLAAIGTAAKGGGAGKPAAGSTDQYQWPF